MIATGKSKIPVIRMESGLGSENTFQVPRSGSPECDVDICPLEWWKGRELSFPDLVRIVKQSIAIPTSSMVSESLELFR